MSVNPFPNYIAGTWVAGNDAAPNINPSDLNDTIGDYARANTNQTVEAIEAATVAFPKWRETSPLVRFEALDRIGSEILARVDELGDMLAREEGKTLSEAKAEAHRAGHLFKYFAAETYRTTGDIYQSLREGVSLKVLREPIGVVGVITPWNFPLAIPAWKIAPALAYGNTVVFKPAELVPGSAWMLSDIIARAGLPEGVFNLVMGTGTEVGAAIVAHPKVSGITFTGSTPVGRKIGAALFARGAKMQLEMGGKNPLIVLDDADLDLAVSLALGGAFGGTGQKCTASSRLIVHAAVHDAFVDKLIAGAQALQVGHALTAGTQLGPVVSQQQLDENLAYVALGKTEGAELACVGDRLIRDTDGYFMAPGVFLNTTNDMRINREEMFAPLAAVIKVDSYGEALQVVNDTHFGLTSGIVTRSLSRATHFRRNARTGCVMVNLPTAGTDYHVPFGGRGSSSYGTREQGTYAAEFYTTVKTAYIASGTPE